MKLGSKGKKLIQDFEQFRATLYDTDGAGHCTVGWGHLVHRGFCDGRENEKQFANRISKATADDLFYLDVKHAEKTVIAQAQIYGLDLNQDQFDALVSFTYNVGSGNLTAMLRSCKEGRTSLEIKKVPACMMRYNRAGSRILPGLTRRRQREADLFEGKSNE
ncbi:MAG TPA: lysozyme [Limnobacter sp.]|nr:lysozyme [Limnobacter sp.]